MSTDIERATELAMAIWFCEYGKEYWAQNQSFHRDEFLKKSTTLILAAFDRAREMRAPLREQMKEEAEQINGEYNND